MCCDLTACVCDTDGCLVVCYVQTRMETLRSIRRLLLYFYQDLQVINIAKVCIKILSCFKHMVFSYRVYVTYVIMIVAMYVAF